MSKRKKLNSPHYRAIARRIRDSHWEFAERVAREGLVWVCWWNKDRYHDRDNLPKDLEVFCLMTGMELVEWMKKHPTWWKIGKWSDKRYAAPVRLTPAGKRAVRKRKKYDMEPVTGGLVEPGWETTPARAQA